MLWPRVGTVPEGAIAELLGRLADGVRRRADEPGRPDGPSPITCVTDLDRIVDMVATSAPRSIPPTVRLRIAAIVQLGASTSLLLSGRAEQAGAPPLEVPVERWDDPEARAALRADAAAAAGALESLADRIVDHGPSSATAAGDSALLDLARQRVGDHGGGAPPVDLVRLGAGLRRICDLSGVTSGVRHGREVTRVA